MICFVCKRNLVSSTLFFKHLRIFHFINSQTICHCLEPECGQYFSNIHSFKKHVEKKHRCNNLNINLIQTEDRIPLESTNDQSSELTPSVSTASKTETKANFEKQLLTTAKTETKVDFEKQLENLKEACALFVLGLANSNNFSRKNVIDIQKNVEMLILKPLIVAIEEFLKSKIPDYFVKFDKLHTFLLSVSELFEQHSTDYKLFSWLEKQDLISTYKRFTIQNQIEEVFKDGVCTFDEKKYTGTLLPLKFLFRKIFEQDDILKETMDSIHRFSSSDRESIENFTQGELWKKKVDSFGDKIVIPYFIYSDDFEINNCLGSHAAPMTAIYFSFPVLFNNSKLKNIFLAGLLKSSDLKTFGNDLCLETFIQELISLEKDGLKIQTNKGHFEVYFVLGLVLGDNLGLNSILGFTKSFSARFFCRFCKCSKEQSQKCNNEKNVCLRNETNYSNDVSTGSLSTSGIDKESIFNRIPTFHVVRNYAIDIMHDIFEGIAHYNMAHIINYFVNDIKLFTLNQLNDRKQFFNYGPSEIGNMSPIIKPEHIINRHFKMSSREMMTFLHHFSLMIGDLVPEKNEVWTFFLNFLKIIDILLSLNISHNTLLYLDHLIQCHLSEYVRLFQDPLKPKHHFLIHYISIIRQSGPPRKYWCFAFESKHKEFKSYAHVITSRLNSPISLAKKFQLKFAYYLINNKYEQQLASQDLILSSPIKSQYADLTKNVVENSQSYLKIYFKGTEYKKKFVLAMFRDYTLVLMEILEIIVEKHTSKIYIVCFEKQITFNMHFEAYEVSSMLPEKIGLVELSKFCGPPLHVCSIANGLQMVRLKEYF